FLFICGIISYLLYIQPSTSVIFILMAASGCVYLASGARLIYVAGTLGLVALAITAMIYVTPYRMQRITSFFNKDANTQTTGYHLSQSLKAIGSGGLLGVGYGQSTTKTYYLPEPIGDSIFAVIAEEWGFIGAIFLILVFLALIIRGFTLSKRADRFGQLVLIGFSSLIGIQAFVNMAAISGLIPLTGMPLPFISYGGTALAVFMTISGIMVNISKYTRN
ncbi:MAG: FtsW/RodA/SpoVE family cell cycle protein, partial [Candidatus Pacebacteria bacterium]|nr:FtsW/RodA/SpoVE family cell cycle protein [Candidatus Paceibacterota bacterium]